ncbi:MAG TPA: hypothetical protein VN442_00130 [Bryobacteraceae bacterium]|nr:hypothetical protein [Bryobacteraceae bacterium]
MPRIAWGLLLAGLVVAQETERRPQPIYRIQVVERSVKAVNYGHRTQPTKVDLKGTILAPEARGEAKVESKRGAVEIEAKVERLDAPTRFGPEYLTYVLWAISPEGRPTNLGELVLTPGNKGKLNVSSELQAFALIVTAEPYFSVTLPSDVVVMENVIRPDTVGKVEEVSARYELLPRGQYTYERPSGVTPPQPREQLSMDQYEAMLSLYQALNAIQIARAGGADRDAGEAMRKAEGLYEKARSLQSRGAQSREVVTLARQATQTAEDARAISVKRREK